MNMKTEISVDNITSVCQDRCIEYLNYINSEAFLDEAGIVSTWSPTLPKILCSSKEVGIVDRILLDAINKSEIFAPGSGDLTFRLCTLVGSEIDKLKFDKDFEDKVLCQISLARKESKFPTSDIIQSYLESNLSTKLSKIVMDTLSISDIDSKIEINKAHIYKIEAKDSFIFDVEIPENFNSTKVFNAKIAVIDGIIEDLSEISLLIEKARLENDSLLLVARGFSSEVLDILSTNFEKRLLNLIPVIVRFDVKANTLVDIAVTTNIDIVSSLKGELISSIKYEELPTIFCKINKNQLVINYLSNKSETLEGHVESLKAKRNKLLNERNDTTIIDERIRSLSSKQILISVKTDSEIHALEKILKDIMHMINTGINCNSCIVTLSHKLNTEKELSYHSNIMPTKYIVSALQHCISFYKSILSIRASIYKID